MRWVGSVCAKAADAPSAAAASINGILIALVLIAAVMTLLPR
jgi:hypothetical protein